MSLFRAAARANPSRMLGARRSPRLTTAAVLAALAGATSLAACGNGAEPPLPQTAGLRTAGVYSEPRPQPVQAPPTAKGSARPTAKALRTAPAGPAATANQPAATSGDLKVAMIMLENKTYSQIIGDPRAPYLNRLASTYASATNMGTAYPTSCPSLAAYILLMSGSTHGICDSAGPSHHQLSGDNLFNQVATSGREWRVYAESMPRNCATSSDGAPYYAVRHTGAPYFTSEATRCGQWLVPMGSATSGALQSAISGGSLPAFSLIVPDLCNGMHGVAGCKGDSVVNGDAWLTKWVSALLAGKDYRSGKLRILITWDEGSDSSNHIPTIGIGPHASKIRASQTLDHCSTLRAIQDLLELPPLGCSASATSMVGPMGLR